MLTHGPFIRKNSLRGGGGQLVGGSDMDWDGFATNEKGPHRMKNLSADDMNTITGHTPGVVYPHARE